MGNTESPAKQRELVAESGHSVKLSLEHQIIHLDRLQGASASEKIYKSLAEIGSKPPFISAGVLIHKSRLFDEGLFAQLEKLLQNGLGRFMGKKVFLKKLAESLLTKFPEPPTKDSTAKDSNKAVSCILAACRLGKIKLDQRENEFKNWQEYLNQFLTEFEMNPVLSRPTSFYCQDEELKTIFKQDRILQTPLKLLEDGKSAQAVADTIKEDPNLFNTYMTYLEIIARISNPLRIPDLSILFGESGDDNIKFDIEVAAIIPPLVSHEEDLLARIIGPGNSVPENFSLLDEFIKFIKARKVSLRPTAESGWYDYSTWSLAPLVSLSSMVESKHLEIEEVYADLLEELFRGRVKRKENENNGSTGDSDAKCSESKAKSETGAGAGAGAGAGSGLETAPPRIQVTIEPSLRVEPLPTFYYRKGFSYKFIRNILLTIFEEDDLRSVKRATTSGEARIDLLAELEFMENLFYGAHRSTCADLGMDPAQTPENCEVVFETWAQNFLTDLDLQPDSRSMIPIAYDVEKRKTRVRCFFGWRKETILVAFARPPEVEIYSKSGKKMPRKDLWLRPTYVGNEGQTGDEISYSFTSKVVETFYPVIDEIEVEKPLDNKAFQEQLDKSGISAFLEKSS